MKIYIGINQKARQEIVDKGITKLPYLNIVLPPEEQGGDWTTVGAAWMNEKKTGFNVRLTDGWELKKKEPDPEEQERLRFEADQKAIKEKKAANNKPKIEYPKDDIKPEDIPF